MNKLRFLNRVGVVARRCLGTRTIRYFRTWTGRIIPDVSLYQLFFEAKAGLEIGGPSAIFNDNGPIPVYGMLASLDNCVYSAHTVWYSHEGSDFSFHPHKQPGKQLICEASDLRAIVSSNYDCVLASHCLEHVANPFRALEEWKRVIKIGGVLLLVLPHKDGTPDRRRPTTTIEHMIADYERNVAEDDLTHLSETLESQDDRTRSREEFRAICLQNQLYRTIHHHVFTTTSAVGMVDRANFQIKRVDTVKPFHIVILAQKCEGPAHNKTFLEPAAEYHRNSPFLSDRAI